MNKTYCTVTLDEMRAILEPRGFQEIQLAGVREVVFAKRVQTILDSERAILWPLSLRVFTSLEGNKSRGVGEDAIRVELAWRAPDGRISHVGGSKRVNRVPGWEKRLVERIEGFLSMLGPPCPRCGAPTKLKTFQDRKFWGCGNYPKCRGSVNYISSNGG